MHLTAAERLNGGQNWLQEQQRAMADVGDPPFSVQKTPFSWDFAQTSHKYRAEKVVRNLTMLKCALSKWMSEDKRSEKCSAGGLRATHTTQKSPLLAYSRSIFTVWPTLRLYSIPLFMLDPPVSLDLAKMVFWKLRLSKRQEKLDGNRDPCG